MGYNETAERLVCPDYFQEEISNAGGYNRYDEPNFKLSWAQTETQWQGGQWDNEEGTFTGYREILKGDGQPHWMLMQWVDSGKSFEMPHMPPESDKVFYRYNQCPTTGLCLLGEYPYQGSYQIVLPLIAKWMEKGKLHIDRVQTLNREIINMMVPIIKATMEVDILTKMKFMKDEEEKDKEEDQKYFEDMYRDIHRNPNLATTSWIEDKQRSIEKIWNQSYIEMMARDKVFQAPPK